MTGGDKLAEVKKSVDEAPAWITTFADLMSLLLCFFVLMLSFSETDRQKFKILSGSLKEAFGVQREYRVWDLPKGNEMISREFKDPKFLEDSITKKIRSAILNSRQGGIAMVEEGEWSVSVTVPGHVLFDLGSARLKEEAYPILDQLREVIRNSENRIVVTGHTDDLPIHTPQYPSNWELSAARAGSVVRYFLSKGDISPNRFIAVGMADTVPRQPNDSPEHRAQNRRVEISFRKIMVKEEDAKRDPHDAWVFDPIFH